MGVEAIAWTDDNERTVIFDCALYLKEASDDELLELDSQNWEKDYAADNVVEYYDQKDKGVTEFFRYVDVTGQGYECSVNKEQAIDWLAENRPEAFQKIVRDCIPTEEG